MPDASLGVLHAGGLGLPIARGHIDPAWLQRLGKRSEARFMDERYVVSVLRSQQSQFVAVAAAPRAQLDRRAAAIAERLVPAALVGPDLFIPVAEQSKLITKITERVLRLVIHDACRFLAVHPSFHVALNLSADDLHSKLIVERLCTVLKDCGALPTNLVVEITERGFLNLSCAREVIGALRERGIEVAIDDFGTGYSSLSYLESLDLDFLKIERSFIEAIGTGAPISLVVGHIIAMARSMGLRMIAEGIESEAQAAFLRERGVEYAQGFLFGRPMSFAEPVQRFKEREHAALLRAARAGADT